MTEDDDLLAAEHALGLADASAREASDPAFAAAVDVWRARLDPLLGPERTPPPHLWDGIVARLPANDVAPADPARGWRFATFAASAVAAVLLGALIVRPSSHAPAPAPQVAAAPARVMVASLTPKQGGGAVSITYDKSQSRLVVNPVGMDARGKTPELWVIPADGKPRSLGVVREKAAASMTVRPEHREMLAEGVTLAVSLEPEGGSPTGQPTGPVVMTGIMSAV
jgi:anti-sigma-K factor RskA